MCLVKALLLENKPLEHKHRSPQWKEGSRVDRHLENIIACRMVPAGLGKLPHPLSLPTCGLYRASYFLASSHQICPQLKTKLGMKLNPSSKCKPKLTSSLVPSAMNRRWPCVTRSQTFYASFLWTEDSKSSRSQSRATSGLCAWHSTTFSLPCPYVATLRF